MSNLKSVAAATLLAAALPVAAMASTLTTQSDDGWDMADIGGVRTAYAQYSSGQTLTVQCISETLNVTFIGLPASAPISTDTSASHYTVTSTASGRLLSHIEKVGNAQPSIAKAVLPARLSHALASAGQITIRSTNAPDIVLDLPSDGTGVREIMRNCATPATDPNAQRPLRALANTQAQGRILRAGLRRLPNNPAPVTQVTAQCIVAPDFKLKFCETARIQPAHARASTYSAIFKDQQITPEDGGTTPIAVGDLVVFNYVMTVGGPQRPTAGAAPAPSGS